jgi:glutathione S-transferase
MNSQLWAAINSLLAVFLMGWIAWRVGKVRVQSGIKAPATTGDPIFERHFRVQMNTLENVVPFLVVLWVAAAYGPAWPVAVGGLVWVAGRVLYALAYVSNPSTRSTGFNVGMAGLGVLIVSALIGVGRAVLGL